MVAGVQHVRILPTHAKHEFTLQPETLEAAVAADREAGLLPCYVVATIGTTSSCAVDPIPAIGALAQRLGLWYVSGLVWSGVSTHNNMGAAPVHTIPLALLLLHCACCGACVLLTLLPAAHPPCHPMSRLHVDAAYAGTFAILPELQHHFVGLELADSFDTNPHKGAWRPN